jgi:hypothetical protein
MPSNVTIGNLTALSTVSDSTVFASENSGLTRKVTAAVLKNYMSSTTTIVATGLINAAGGISSNTVQAATIGNAGTVLTGTISTDYQPNITGLGTLANLTVTGNTTIGGNINLSGNLIANNSASFAAINNTVIGNVSHTIGRFTTVTATTVNAGTIGNSGATLTGTLSTAAQTNITSLGTLTSLAVTGNVSTGNVSGTKGTLSAVTVTGAATVGNVITTNGVFWANGTAYSSGGGGSTAASSLTGATLASGVTASSLTSVGTLTGLTVSGAIIPNANVSIDLGSSSAWFNNIYGVSIQAKYADLAENYTAIEDYPAGTVVAWAGEVFTEDLIIAEVSHTHAVAGVISTDPAYLMNAAVPGLPLALSGRVPCHVLGPITKGDRLAVVAPGTAGRLDPLLYQPGCVIGYALASVPDGELATIEVVIMKF